MFQRVIVLNGFCTKRVLLGKIFCCDGHFAEMHVYGSSNGSNPEGSIFQKVFCFVFVFVFCFFFFKFHF